METITLETLEDLLVTRFAGVLRSGYHAPASGECCALELLSAAQGREWTDDPEVVRTFDLRLINDIPVTNEVRTQYLLPVLVAYAGSLDWPLARQWRVADRLLIETTRRLLSILPGLTEATREQCRNAFTVSAARRAVLAVGLEARPMALVAREMEAVTSPLRAAKGAAEMAMVVAREVGQQTLRKAGKMAAAVEAREAAFITACEIWLEAAGAEGTEEGGEGGAKA
jgi:hypothetical protein